MLVGPCECSFPEYCDSQRGNSSAEADVEAMAEADIASLEVIFYAQQSIH